MKYLFAVTAIAASISTLHAEPKEYSGTLRDIPVTATLNWLDEKNLAGVIVSNDGNLQLALAGQNSGSGVIKAVLTKGVQQMATVKLTKTTTEASIIWTGQMTSPQGADAGVLELRRPR